MKKSTGLFLALSAMVIFPVKSYAQWEIGASVGASHNSLTTSSSYQYDRIYTAQGGVAAAIPVSYRFKDWFAVQGELAYTQKNYEWHRSKTLFPSFNYYQFYGNSFLQLPVMANFSFGGERLRGFLNLGGYVGAWIDSRTKGSIPLLGSERLVYHFDEQIPFDSKRDNCLDAGLLAGIGLEYRINRLIKVFVEGRYQYGLTDLQKGYMLEQIPQYNNTLTVQAGVSFRIGK